MGKVITLEDIVSMIGDDDTVIDVYDTTYLDLHRTLFEGYPSEFDGVTEIRGDVMGEEALVIYPAEDNVLCIGIANAIGW
jgi:hypothetical protein